MSIVDLVQSILNKTSLILNIFCQLLVLPLAYQLTCIAGNLLVSISIFFSSVNKRMFLSNKVEHKLMLDRKEMIIYYHMASLSEISTIHYLKSSNSTPTYTRCK
jgi:hypothetical protein